MGSGGEIDSGQHQAGSRTRTAGAASCRRSDPRRRRRGCQRCGTCVGWAIGGPPGCRPGPLAGMQVRVLPDALGGTSRWQATAAVSKTEGPHGRASSILAPSARLCRSSWSGRPPVEREITGSSPVRSAQRRGGCWLPIRTFNPGRAGSIPVHGTRTRPHGLVVKDARFSAGRTPVQVRLGVRRGGDRCPGLPCKQAVWGSIPRRSTSRHGGESVFADEAHVDAHLLAMQELAGSRPVIRSVGCSRPAWRNQVDARRSERRALWGVPVRVRGRVRNGL